ncbi:uncharacterized protein LOC112091030 [Morus notabilis]|uniref:uncharacterized protein LOC112091030 n=1 Tax=Morus notabilis TaxID=981085 RepID=UPI000CED65F4|nr:uncharacterized protein LOC112091030 [Morus notabilis]
MDLLKEGGSVSRPPLLDGSNYSYWKARMKAFIKAQDEKAWRAVLTGWKHPVTKDTEGKENLKPEESWSTDEDRLANYNSRALNAIFNGVDVNHFKMISTCESTKDAWEILEVAHEGTATVRQSKLNMLTTRFETLRMLEIETISEFNSRLCDIANESFALGEKISEAKLSVKPEENGNLFDSDSFSNDGELTHETIQEAYESMFNKWIQVVKLNKSLEKKLADVVQEKEDPKMRHESKIAEMRKRLQEANAELERTQKTLKMMNTGTAKLDHIFSMRKSSHDHFGLGYSGECQSSNFPGHIQPRCYKYLNALKRGMHLTSPNVARQTPKRKINGDNRSTRKVWVRKSDLSCHAAYTSLKASTTNSWYFESGCSRHMTGERSFLKNFKSLTDGHVTFGDGVKGKVLGRGILDVDGLPKLKNVLLVEGLKANLISISQLCDQELFVSFSKNKCRVLDEEENCVMEGSRSSDNY